jgi:hypothetical protein
MELLKSNKVEGCLGRAEEDAVKMFKKAPVNEADVTVSHADKYKKQKTSDYIPTEHVLVDSNICERSFSKARQFMHYLRAHIAPESLELLLFLYCNKEYWNNSIVIDKSINWDLEKKKAKKAADDEAAAAAARESNFARRRRRRRLKMNFLNSY